MSSRLEALKLWAKKPFVEADHSAYRFASKPRLEGVLAIVSLETLFPEFRSQLHELAETSRAQQLHQERQELLSSSGENATTTPEETPLLTVPQTADLSKRLDASAKSKPKSKLPITSIPWLNVNSFREGITKFFAAPGLRVDTRTSNEIARRELPRTYGEFARDWIFFVLGAFGIGWAVIHLIQLIVQGIPELLASGFSKLADALCSLQLHADESLLFRVAKLPIILNILPIIFVALIFLACKALEWITNLISQLIALPFLLINKITTTPTGKKNSVVKGIYESIHLAKASVVGEFFGFPGIKQGDVRGKIKFVRDWIFYALGGFVWMPVLNVVQLATQGLFNFIDIYSLKLAYAARDVLSSAANFMKEAWANSKSLAVLAAIPVGLILVGGALTFAASSIAHWTSSLISKICSLPFRFIKFVTKTSVRMDREKLGLPPIEEPSHNPQEAAHNPQEVEVKGALNTTSAPASTNVSPEGGGLRTLAPRSTISVTEASPEAAAVLDNPAAPPQAPTPPPTTNATGDHSPPAEPGEVLVAASQEQPVAASTAAPPSPTDAETAVAHAALEQRPPSPAQSGSTTPPSPPTMARIITPASEYTAIQKALAKDAAAAKRKHDLRVTTRSSSLASNASATSGPSLPLPPVVMEIPSPAGHSRNVSGVIQIDGGRNSLRASDEHQLLSKAEPPPPIVDTDGAFASELEENSNKPANAQPPAPKDMLPAPALAPDREEREAPRPGVS